MKKIVLLLVIFFCVSCKTYTSFVSNDQENVNTTLNIWHKAAANAQYDLYFDQMTVDGIFIGTDPTENWQNDALKAFAKPFFDKGEAWHFSSVQRNIYFNDRKDIAWFDELLDTQMKICRGSGVLKKINGKWKIAHYVLSIAIPNENTDAVVKLKAAFDDQLLLQLKK